MDSLFLKALACQPTSRPPVWLMRQAGRYMAEYRALKEKYTFLQLCENPELAAQITLMPIKRFGFDAAIMFADILLILQTLDFGLTFVKGCGPRIDTKEYLEDVTTITASPVEEKLSYIKETIKNLKQELKIPLIGFCGAPFTLATYLLEKKSSKTFEKTKTWIQSNPHGLHHILQILTDQTIDYLKMQIQAGVDAIQIFDSWACFFPLKTLQEFSYPYLKQIIDALKPFNIPIILFAKGSFSNASQLASLGPQALSLDHEGDLLELSKTLPKSLALQGNLNPDLLFGPIEDLQKETTKLCNSMKNRPGFIFNLGHGIKPHSKVENVECLIDTIKNMSY